MAAPQRIIHQSSHVFGSTCYWETLSISKTCRRTLVQTDVCVSLPLTGVVQLINSLKDEKKKEGTCTQSPGAAPGVHIFHTVALLLSLFPWGVVHRVIVRPGWIVVRRSRGRVTGEERQTGINASSKPRWQQLLVSTRLTLVYKEIWAGVNCG